MAFNTTAKTKTPECQASKTCSVFLLNFFDFNFFGHGVR